MNILYLTEGREVDYQADCLLIGLKELYGNQVVDVRRANHLYQDFNMDQARHFHGKGFTVCGILPNLEVDRSDIESKIMSKYFDYIIYGSIWRCNYYLDLVLSVYPRNRVCFIDGEDEPYRVYDAKSLGIPYFKRELSDDLEGIYPISFGFPTSLISINKDKIRDHSIVMPLDSPADYMCAAGKLRNGYIYNNQEEYYDDYNKSRFGITCKKGGWDCLRHYEIMAQGCIPKFLDLADCPKNSMVNFPKDICLNVLKDLETESCDVVYDRHIDNLMSHFVNHNTTLALAKYVINTLESLK